MTDFERDRRTLQEFFERQQVQRVVERLKNRKWIEDVPLTDPQYEALKAWAVKNMVRIP